MTENDETRAPANHDDAEGHLGAAGSAPSLGAAGSAPDFTMGNPGQSDDDVEGHISGAVSVDPTLPSAVDPRHPKLGDERI